MLNSFSYKANRLQGCVQTLLTTDLTAYLFIMIAIYLAIAAAFSFSLDSFLPAGVDLKWLRAMDGITLIVGFVYYIWIRDAMDGWAVAPTAYRDMLNKIVTFSEKYAALHRSYKDTSVIIEVRDACVAMIYLCYRLFDPGDPEEDEYDEPLQYDINKMNLNSDAVRQIVSMKDNDERSIAFVMRDLITMINSRIKAASEAKTIKNAEINLLMQELHRILVIIESIDTNGAVPSPTIFKSHILFTLFVYFGLWLPFYFWGSIGTSGNLLLYPLTMFILTGIPLYRTWMGDPFDHSRPIHIIDYDEWKASFQHRIDHVFHMLEPEHEDRLISRSIPRFNLKQSPPKVDDVMMAFNYV